MPNPPLPIPVTVVLVGDIATLQMAVDHMRNVSMDGRYTLTISTSTAKNKVFVVSGTNQVTLEFTTPVQTITWTTP